MLKAHFLLFFPNFIIFCAFKIIYLVNKLLIASQLWVPYYTLCAC